MEGVSLIIHRYRGVISIGKLLLYKVHIFTNLIRDKYVEFGYTDSLKSLMNGML
jgi:hypothetical protein